MKSVSQRVRVIEEAGNTNGKRAGTGGTEAEASPKKNKSTGPWQESNSCLLNSSASSVGHPSNWWMLRPWQGAQTSSQTSSRSYGEEDWSRKSKLAKTHRARLKDIDSVCNLNVRNHKFLRATHWWFCHHHCTTLTEQRANCARSIANYGLHNTFNRQRITGAIASSRAEQAFVMGIHGIQKDIPLSIPYCGVS